MTQTAVSWRIRAIERQLGARVFERTSKGVRLTATGRVFLRHAEGISAATRAALADAAANAPPEDRIAVQRRRKPGRKPGTDR